MKKLKMVFVAQVAGMAIVIAACGVSYQSGYDHAIRDRATLRKFINEGRATPRSYCQDLLTLVRKSSNASDVDGSDFLSGCLDGVERALDGSYSYQSGYDYAIRDRATLRKFINEGRVTPRSYCQDLLTLVRKSSNASDVDGSNFLRGCLDGVQRALDAG